MGLFPARGAPPEQFELKLGTIGGLKGVSALVQVQPGGKDARQILDPLATSIYQALKICKPLQERLSHEGTYTASFNLAKGRVHEARLPDRDFTSGCINKNLREVSFPDLETPLAALFRITFDGAPKTASR